MEKIVKKTSIMVFSILVVGSSFAAEVDPNFANTQRICQCFEKTGTPNCQPLNASNTEEANRNVPAAANTGAHRQ